MSRGAAAAVVVSLMVLATFTGFLVEAPSVATTGPLRPVASSEDMPSARDTHEMAFDAESDRIVLFGGSSEHSLCDLSDTWVYDVANNSWQDMRPAVAPSARCCPGMVYDSKADRLIMFGGAAAGAGSYLNDTWAYDLNANTWTNRRPAVSPPARHGGPLVYDIRLDRIILFGGATTLAFNDTWTYDFDSNTWAQVATATSPSLRVFHAMAYDIESDRVVLFGGETEPYSYASDETWVYDAVGETWSKMAPVASPAPRFAAPAAYDAKADRFLVFAGTGYPDDSGRNDTWAYDFNADTWSRIDTPVRPSNRLTAMTHSAKSDRTVLFGGTWPFRIFGSPAYNRETWIFDYGNSTWTMMLPDTVNPSLAIASPADGATLASTTATVTGTASDNAGVRKVEVSLDNTTWITATGTTSWSATLTLAEGVNTIYVRVTDTAGNTATSTIHVTVATPGGQGIPIWVWPLAAVGIAGVAVAAYVLTRRRRKPAAESPSPQR